MTNYFELYNIPLDFILEAAQLRKIYFRRSKALHPDFHTDADAELQAAMLQAASLNNEAYTTLTDPDKRMRHLLELKGVLTQEMADNHPLPQDFLMQVMDLSDLLMELEMDPTPENRLAFEQEVAALEKIMDDEMQETLKNWSDTPENQSKLEKIKIFYLKRRYLLRIQNNLNKFAP